MADKLSSQDAPKVAETTSPSNEVKVQPTPTAPQSVFRSSLSYTNVRDFAYPDDHPLHYGPPPVPSRTATPGSTRNSGIFSNNAGLNALLGTWWNHPHSSPGRRLSDPASSNDYSGWRDPRAFHNYPPPLKFQDGPPWSEDEDLASPVVISNRSRKHKSTMPAMGNGGRIGRGHSQSMSERERPGFRRGSEPIHRFENGGDIGDHFATDLGEPGGVYNTQGGEYFSDDIIEDDDEYEEVSDDEFEHENSRFSKDYHFSIASPDEEMHGKAVALFDFTRENDNELGLVEGQVIWVSYRHGQGWLVAEDPKTGESGLVPEEYVRLFREIQDQQIIGLRDSVSPSTAFFSGATSSIAEALNSPQAPTASAVDQPELSTSPPHNPAKQSHFSTSSKDLEKYPHTDQLHDPTRLDSPPIISRNGASRSRTLSTDRKEHKEAQQHTKLEPTAMEIDEKDVSSSSSSSRENTMQQRKLADGKVLNGQKQGEQQEYQSLHHKSPSMSSTKDELAKMQPEAVSQMTS